jgi:D-alanine-D-alanine ligase
MAELHFGHCNTLNLPVKVWVLAPLVITKDETIDYYYDFSQSIEEYTKTFAALNLQWQWQPVTMEDYDEVIEQIVVERDNNSYFPIVLNICDGDEVNGTPGISVVKLLEERKLVYTGSEEFFYHITTSKTAMKKRFDKAKVPTPAWEAIKSERHNVKGLFERLGTPVIIKPSVSGGSMGVGTKNVVHNETEALALIKKMFEGYRGWNLATDGLIAEAFIPGQEFTSFLVGDHNNPAGTLIYEPVERVFHESLPENEKFLSFDRLWEIYEEEEAMPNEENFYEYAPVSETDIEEVKKLSWKAFVSVKGTGYTRIDIRKDNRTGKLYVLEVNAQCGISEDENFTSIGAILKVSGKTFSELVLEIINNALERHIIATSSSRKKAMALVNVSNGR